MTKYIMAVFFVMVSSVSATDYAPGTLFTMTSVWPIGTGSGTVIGGGYLPMGSMTRLVPIPSIGSTFEGIAGDPGCALLMAVWVNRNCTARFTQSPRVILSIIPTGSGGVNGNGWHDIGETVNLYAVPTAGWTWDGTWDGDPGCGPVVVVTGHMNCYVTFVEDQVTRPYNTSILSAGYFRWIGSASVHTPWCGAEVEMVAPSESSIRPGTNDTMFVGLRLETYTGLPAIEMGICKRRGYQDGREWTLCHGDHDYPGPALMNLLIQPNKRFWIRAQCCTGVGTWLLRYSLDGINFNNDFENPFLPASKSDRHVKVKLEMKVVGLQSTPPRLSPTWFQQTFLRSSATSGPVLPCSIVGPLVPWRDPQSPEYPATPGVVTLDPPYGFTIIAPYTNLNVHN